MWVCDQDFGLTCNMTLSAVLSQILEITCSISAVLQCTHVHSVSRRHKASAEAVLIHAVCMWTVNDMQVVSAGDGEAITAVKASLDGSVLAVQRSSAFLQFVHVRSSKMFVQVDATADPSPLQQLVTKAPVSEQLS